MTALDDEIARIAALRGRTSDTASLIAEQARAQRRIPWADIDLIFDANPNPTADLAAYDALPEAVRTVLREAPVLAPLNAAAALRLIEMGKDVDAIIKAVQQRLSATA